MAGAAVTGIVARISTVINKCDKALQYLELFGLMKPIIVIIPGSHPATSFGLYIGCVHGLFICARAKLDLTNKIFLNEKPIPNQKLGFLPGGSV
jgi:hypothetical protein